MYSIPYFKEEDKSQLLQFLTEYPFAFLTGSFLNGQQVATQVPMLIEKSGNSLILRGHIMRNTDHHQAFLENPKALAVFTGPNAYVSASWYANPRIGSTWNYMSVQVSGELSFMSPEKLLQFMREFTLYFEEGNTVSPTIYDNLPIEFLDKMMPGIAGFEIRAERIENVFKLSQNRDEESYRNIITRLEGKGGDPARIAQEMRKRQGNLFRKHEA